MWKQKRGNKYRFFEQYKDPLTNKTKTISVTMQDSKKKTAKEAQIILNNRINKIISRVDNSKLVHGVTLKELIGEFKIDEKKRVRRSTIYNHQTMINTILNEFDKDTLVENITPLVISDFIENLMYGKRHISSGYGAKYKYFFHNLMEFAVKHSYVKENPVDKVEIDYPSPVSKGKIENKFFESNELNKFLKFAYSYNTTYAQLCEWLYLTGSRIGEATSLDFNDVKKKNGHWVVDITGTLDYNHVQIKDQHKSDHTKTATSTRTVVLPQKAMDIYHERQKITGGHGFIFCTTHGTPIQTSAINTFLRTAKQHLNIDKPISSHIFRHTHISKLAELGMPLYVIQQRVGHGDSKITKQIYLHVTQNVIDKEAPKLENL